MSGILRLESLTKGNTLKQGDKTPLKYRLFDADGEKLNIAGKSAKVRLVYPDFLTIGYEKDGLTVAQDDTVTFTIDGVIPSRIYHVEIIVDDKYIFPSRADESKFTVDKSSLGTESNIVEIVGVDAVVRKAVDLINQDPSLIIDEDKLVTDIISNTGIGNINEYYKAFNDLKPKAEQSITKSSEALTKSQNALNVANGIDAKATNALSLSESADTLSKSVQEQFNQVVIDGDSSVEAAQARVDASGQTNATLKDRLDKEHNEVTAQLAQTKQRFEENPNSFIGKGPKDTRPVITFITDDARRQDITIFKDMFQRVGLPVSTAVTPYRSINTPDYGNVYLTVDEIRTLQDDFGWEIVSHTWNHERLTEISDEALDFTLKESRDWLRDNGFKGYEYLMYPFGLYDERVKRYSAKYYRAARTTAGLWGNVINEFPVASYQLSTRFFSQTVSLEMLKADVDRLIERGGWLNLFFHSWEIDDWNREDDFEEFLNYVKDKQDLGLLDVMGYKDTYERYGNVIDQASYVDKNDDMFILQQNGNIRTNFGKTKKIPNNSLNNSSLPNEFPLDYTSYMTSTLAENGFPTASGTLETIYFSPNPNEPTNARYCRQTYYPYNSSLIYTRGYLASGWTAWSTPGSGTSTPTESQFAIITGSAVDGNTPPNEFPASKLTLYSKGTNTPGMPTTIGGIFSVYKVASDYSFWYQEYKASGGNRKWRRYATSLTTWSPWQLVVSDYGGTRPTNVSLGFMFFDATIGKPIWLKSEGVWVDATGATV